MSSQVKHSDRLNRLDFVYLFVVLVASIATKIYKLGDASLWLDESSTLRFSRLPFSTLWVSAYDTHPPLYYTIISLITNFGDSEFAVRFPSVVFSVLTVVVIYIATRKIAGSTAALAASVMLSLSFHNLEYSQEARNYALLNLCLACSFLGLVVLSQLWQRSPSGITFATFLTSGAALYSLGLLGALYTHNITVFKEIFIHWFTA